MITQKEDLGIIGVVVEDWDIEKSFKPKTITTDYESWIAYISRRPVPANTPITDSYYWKPLTRLQSQLAFDYQEFKAYVEKRLKTMDLEIESFLRSVAGGSAITDIFGDSELVAVNQKIQTDATNRIYALLEEALGRTLLGFTWTINPVFFISETPKTISIDVTPTNTGEILEKVYLTVNGIKVEGSDRENVSNAHYEVELSETSTIRVDAQVLGVHYHREQVVTRYNEFFMGCGTIYTDVMDGTPAHTVDIRGGMRLAKNITAEDNDYIFIIIGNSLYNDFIRADMNGIEIPFNVDTTTLEGYVILKSQNTYEAGTYNIDING